MRTLSSSLSSPRRSAIHACLLVAFGAVAMACSAASAPPGGDDVGPSAGTTAKAGAGGSSTGTDPDPVAGAGGTAAQGGAGTNAGSTGDAGNSQAGAGGTGGAGTGGVDPGAGGEASGGSPDGGGGDAGGGQAGGGGGIDIPSDPQVSLVYAHSPTSLYQMDPATKALSLVGDFTCLFDASMWDIAVDSQGTMVGTASDRMVSIDPLTAKCKTLANGSFPNSLTFIPKGTLDPSAEALVGFRDSEYVRIDPVNGKISVVGDLNPNTTGEEWESSGDVVSIIGDKTYLTVHPVSLAWSGTDTIVEVDPLTGKAVKKIGDVGFGKLWGLAYWDSIAYGFSDAGQLIQIDLTTGAGKSVALPTALKNLSFYGAGVTTAARITPPK
jgi:hypothetical protein